MRRLQPNDTDPSIEALRIEGFRAMSAGEKLRLVSALTRTVFELALSDVRSRYPDESDREHLLRVASRWTPRDVMKRGFGWDVEERGY